MKKCVISILLLNFLLTHNSYSQISDDSSGVIYGWILNENLISAEKIDIDTDLVDFQLAGSIFKIYNSVSYLGNYGSAYSANNFFDRKYDDDLLFLSSYEDYFSTYKNTCYINTRKPFSRIIYLNSGQKSDKFEMITLSHTQNVTKKLNIGFDIKIASDKGQYRYLGTKNKSFKFFSSYSGERYSMHSSFDLNRYSAGENGGILDDFYLQNDDAPKEYPTNFDSTGSAESDKPFVVNKIRYVDGMISQRLKLFTIGGANSDTLKESRNVAEPYLSYVFAIRRSSKVFTENSANTSVIPIFRNYYGNPIETYDSIAQLNIINRVQVDFKTKLRNKVIAGIYANINHEYQNFTYYTLVDSTLLEKTSVELYQIDSASRFSLYLRNNGDTILDINRNYTNSNVFVSGGIYGKFWTNLQSSFSAKIYIAGYKAGETQLTGNILSQIKILKNPYLFKIQGSIENLVPSFQLSNYYTNNYIWKKDFNSLNRISLSSKIIAPSNKFELSGDYCLLRNYIYLTDSIPLAYEENFNVLAIGIEKEFVLWKFHSVNKFVYQVSENKSILDLPEIIYFNSTYFDNTWLFKLTNGKLRTMLGADIRYNSSFYGYNYNPAISQFYQASSYKIGNYPFIDFWFSMNLKRALLFVKLEHYNSDWNRKDYYNAISYPANQKMLKFGLSWTFYD